MIMNNEDHDHAIDNYDNKQYHVILHVALLLLELELKLLELLLKLIDLFIK